MKKSHLTIGFTLLLAIFVLALIQTYNTLSVPTTAYLNEDQMARVGSFWPTNTEFFCMQNARIRYNICVATEKTEEGQPSACLQTLKMANLHCLDAKRGYYNQEMSPMSSKTNTASPSSN